jgi:enoyl-CoA hydratase/carnithine racemase
MSTSPTPDSWTFETLTVQIDGAVLFAEISAPPMNLLGPELVRDLASLIQRAEADDALNVLVFTSADPDYFISHVDVTRIAEYRAEATKLVGEPSIALLFRHLSASRLVSIAQIEGRVRGAGSEFVPACDMRFAARESAIFAQFEPAFGLIPGGGATQHLVRLMGRRPGARGHVERAGLRRRAGRAIRLDQPRDAGRRPRRLRQDARSPDRGIPGRRTRRGQGTSQCDHARTSGRVPTRFRSLRPRTTRA